MYDCDKVEQLKDKEYRDAYMADHVRVGIAYQIQALREQAGLTQAQFAELLGTRQSVISRLENTEYGKVSVQTLLDIASALDIALSVRFCDYREFLDNIADISPAALRVARFDETVWDSQQRSTEVVPVVVFGTSAAQPSVRTATKARGKSPWLKETETRPGTRDLTVTVMSTQTHAALGSDLTTSASCSVT